jgi:hypothetical protein
MSWNGGVREETEQVACCDEVHTDVDIWIFPVSYLSYTFNIILIHVKKKKI